MKRPTLGALACVVVICHVANAAPVLESVALLRYTSGVHQQNPNGAVGPYSTLADQVDASVNADPLEAGIGDGQIGLTLTLDPARWAFTSWNENSYEAAASARDFWTWGFEVLSPVQVDLNRLEIGDLRSSRLTAGGGFPTNFEIRVAVNDGPSTSLVVHDYSDETQLIKSYRAADAIDLSHLPVVRQGDHVVFTLAAFSTNGAADATGLFELRADHSITIDGFVLIPEPLTLAWAASLAWLSIVRRRPRFRSGA